MTARQRAAEYELHRESQRSLPQIQFVGKRCVSEVDLLTQRQIINEVESQVDFGKVQVMREKEDIIARANMKYKSLSRDAKERVVSEQAEKLIRGNLAMSN